ncbi:hypothetical protein KQI89_13675 [Clostridium sp. MSJ-4]|uniref:Holin n=1 Tax=Clostridium simiarum TaxID=2841506 RepID=A0ABS6F2P9_9CLOT|nr:MULTISPECIES: hypothetical protein [Clostridium]MBU5592797.1 hypothetical protein [Clostridium simiarum]
MFNFQDIGLMTAVVMGLSQVAKELGIKVKLIPILNLILGLIAGIVYVAPGDLKTGIFSGLTIGLTASGFYSGVKNVRQEFRR